MLPLYLQKYLGMQDIIIYNTLTRKKEKFVPNELGHVGMYVCGPTVYGDAHLGHTRPAITFDVVYRYLKYAGFKVRYVRNITDVGHLKFSVSIGVSSLSKQVHNVETLLSEADKALYKAKHQGKGGVAVASQ